MPGKNTPPGHSFKLRKLADPGLYSCTTRIILIAPKIDAEKDLLYDIFNLLLIAENFPSDSESHFAMSVKEDLKALPAAGLKASDQFRVFRRAIM